jgi:hypothetical protein
MIVFFNIRGVILIQWVPEDQTVNQNDHLEILTGLRERVMKKWPALLKNKSWILHSDNTPTLDFLAVKQYLANKCNSSVPTPSYLPDLAPCNVCLIPKVTSALKGTNFLSAAGHVARMGRRGTHIDYWWESQRERTTRKTKT